MVLNDNFFVETMLPKSILRTLSDQEIETYRTPFKSPAAQTTYTDLAT